MGKWQDSLRRLDLKEASIKAYISSGEGFESWLRANKKITLNDLIAGDLEAARAAVLEYVRSYLGGSPSQNRGVIGHISRIFSACGRKLPFKELVSEV